MSVDPLDPKLNPPAPGEGDPPGDGTGGSDPPGGDDGGQGDEPQDVEGYKALIAKLRLESKTATRDAAAATKKQRDLETALKTREDAEKSEAEKLAERAKAAEERAATLERDARAKALRYSVTDAARTLGVVNPDHLARLLDLDDVEFDEKTGDPIGIPDLVKAFVSQPENKYLVGDANPAKPGPPATEKPGRNGNGPSPEEQQQALTEFKTHTLNKI